MIYDTAQIRSIFFAILLFGSVAQIFAGAGDLDLTFDGDGKAIADNGSNFESIEDLAVKPDGKIVAVGPSGILRFNPDGSPDL